VVRDAVEPQRERGILPKVNEVRGYVQGIVERMDRKQSEAKPAPTAAPRPVEPRRFASVEEADDHLQTEYKRRMSRRGLTPIDGKWTVTRRPVANVTGKRTVMDIGSERVAKRIAQIRRDPEWRLRGERINPLALDGSLGADKQEKALEMWRQLIEDSNRKFGDWRKDKPARIWNRPALSR
jgi:hypothetical protein